MSPNKIQTPLAPLKSYTEMFRLPEEEFGEVAVAAPALSSSEKTVRWSGPVADLGGLAKFWLLPGRGGAGKTTLGRWLGGHMIEEGLSPIVIADLDPTNRTLSTFFEGVMQPASTASGDADSFLRTLMAGVSSNTVPGFCDFGGGDGALPRLVALHSGFYTDLEAAGVALVAAYVLTPAVDDLAVLAPLEAAGFRPRATALILNLGRAQRLGDFAALRAQRAYKEAIGRGAVEIIMPRLDADLAREIERKRLHFHDAVAGRSHSEAVMAVQGLNSYVVKAWMDAMTVAFEPIVGWMPWS